MVYLTNWPYCNAKLFPVNKLMIFCSFHHCWIFISLEFFCIPFLLMFTINKKYRNLYMIYIFICNKTLFKLKMEWFALTFLHTPVKWCVSSTLFFPFPTHNIFLRCILAERCTFLNSIEMFWFRKYCFNERRMKLFIWRWPFFLLHRKEFSHQTRGSSLLFGMI